MRRIFRSNGNILKISAFFYDRPDVCRRKFIIFKRQGRLILAQARQAEISATAQSPSTAAQSAEAPSVTL